MHWHGLKQKSRDLSYANLLQISSNLLPFKVFESASLEKRFNDVACLAIRECHGKSGRKKQQLLKKTRSVRIGEDEIDKHEPVKTQHGDGIECKGGKSCI